MTTHRQRTLQAKDVIEFIRKHPEGVTAEDLYRNGLSTQPITRLLKLGMISAEQVKEPERGPRAYHWLWIPTGGMVKP